MAPTIVQPDVPLPKVWQPYMLLSVGTLNRYPAHILALYTQTVGGWRTGKPMCLVKAVDAGGVPNSTDTVIQFQTAAQDTDGMYSSTSPTQLTVQTTGWYRVVLQVHWDTTTTGRRACKIMVNGIDPGSNAIASDARDLGTPGEGTLTSCEGLAHLAAGATIYGNVWQSSGGTLHFVSGFSGTFLSAEWLMP